MSENQDNNISSDAYIVIGCPAWLSVGLRSLDLAAVSQDDRLVVASALDALCAMPDHVWSFWTGEDVMPEVAPLPDEGSAKEALAAMLVSHNAGIRSWRHAATALGLDPDDDGLGGEKVDPTPGIVEDEDGSYFNICAPTTTFEVYSAARPSRIQGQTIKVMGDALRMQLTQDGRWRPVLFKETMYVYSPISEVWEPLSNANLSDLHSQWVGAVVVGYKKDKATGQLVPIYYNGAHKDQHLVDQVSFGLAQMEDARGKFQVYLALSDKVLFCDVDRAEINVEDLGPQHYVTAENKYSFDLATLKSATAPRWEQYLLDMFPEADDPHLMVEYLKRWIGIAAFGANIEFQLPALILRGLRGTGKSTLATIVKTLFPEGSTCEVAIHRWKDAFERDNLRGKRLNVDTELEINEPLEGLAEVKKIIFGEATSAGAKHVQNTTLRSRCAHLFCGNGLPNMRRPDAAVYRRFAVMQVSRESVTDAKIADTKFAEHLVAEELPGIIRSVTEAFKRALVDRRDRPQGTSMGLPILPDQEIKEEWQRDSDPVATFFAEEYEHDDSLSLNRSITVADAHRRFMDWCKDNGHAVWSRQSFKAQAANYYKIKQVNKQDCLVGCVRRTQWLAEPGSGGSSSGGVNM